MSQAASKELEFRYERKFLVENRPLSELLLFLRINPAGFDEIYTERTINNIYFDSADWQSYYSNVEGNTNRRKVRIRWYGDFWGKTSKPVLEFKIKQGLVGTKEQYLLQSFDFDQNTTLEQLHRVFEASNLPLYVLHELKGLFPVLLNRYNRRYYLSKNKLVRATIDFNLGFYHTKLTKRNITQYQPEDNVHIIELKYSREHDSYARLIASHLPYQLSKSSKYVTGIERMYL